MPRTLPAAAWAFAGTHLVASIAMAIWLVPGFPTGGTTVAERLAYVQANATVWTIGWLLWHPCAVTFAWTAFALLAVAHARGVGARRWMWHGAIAASLGAVACDLAGQWALILCAGDGVSTMRFGGFEDWGGQLTGFWANGLYTAALGGCTVLLWPVWTGALRGLSVAVLAAGAGLSLSTLGPWPPGQMASTAVLMPGVIVWSVMVARWGGGEAGA